MREFWILVGYLLVALRRALTVAWIRLNKFLSSSDWQIRPVTDFRHKVGYMTLRKKLQLEQRHR